MTSKEAAFSNGQKSVEKRQELIIFRQYCLVLWQCNVIYEKIMIIIVICWYLLDARHCIRASISLSYLILVITLQDSHHVNFINEESKVQKLSNLPKITQLASKSAAEDRLGGCRNWPKWFRNWRLIFWRKC